MPAPAAGPGLATVPHSVPPSARRRRGLHLTRRGRLLAVLGLVGLLLAAFSLGRASTPASASSAVSLRPTTAPRAVVVYEGDTLWEIARRVAPRSDPRHAIEQVRRVNGLSGYGLAPGQRLVLPG